jgi:RNA polymerase sigma-70 factor, ECF subfamily
MWRADPFSDPKPLIRSVYAYVAYRLGDGPEAEDVTSETFARALRYRESFDARKGEPIGWLIGIARRCIADAALSRRSYQELDDATEPAAPGDVEADTIRRLELRQAVAALDETGRELVALRFGADLSARQIAELTGKSTHAVEVALSRTLERLRKSLETPEKTELRPVRFLSPRRYPG